MPAANVAASKLTRRHRGRTSKSCIPLRPLQGLGLPCRRALQSLRIGPLTARPIKVRMTCPASVCSSVGASPVVRPFAGGWVRADLAQGVQPRVAISEDEQLIATRFECAEVADLREPGGTLIPDRTRGPTPGRVGRPGRFGQSLPSGANSVSPPSFFAPTLAYRSYSAACSASSITGW